MALTKVNNDLQDALAAAQPSITSTGTLTGLTVTGEITANGGIALGDGDAATFGDSDDLSISHAGGSTYLTNTTGSLVLRSDSFRVLNTANSEQILHGDANGAVTAYYDNAAKLATTATGIAITQSGSDVGLLVTGGSYNYTAKFESSDAEANIIIEDSNSTANANMIGVATNDMYFITNGSERLKIDASGRVGINRTPSITGSKLEVGGADNVSLINVEASGVTGGMGIGATGLQLFHGSSAKVKIDSAGRVTMPSQPHWRGLITRGAGGGAGVADVSSNQDVRGSGLTFANSRVTVPVAGVYQVNFNAILGNGTNALRYDAYLSLNGTSIVESLNDLATGFHYRSISLAVRMAANDYLQFYCQEWYAHTQHSTWKTASVTLIS